MSICDENGDLERGYLQMAADEQRELAALEWCNALIADISVAGSDMGEDHNRL